MNKFAVILFLAFMIFNIDAHPRTRTVKDHRRSYGPRPRDSSTLSNKPTCERNVPCGWALYRQTYSNALRPIFQYTKNNFCNCSPETECVYKENRAELRAYVFYCRRVRSNEDFYRFPDTS